MFVFENSQLLYSIGSGDSYRTPCVTFSHRVEQSILPTLLCIERGELYLNMACSVVKEENNEDASQDEDEEPKEGDGKGPDYDYLLGMTMWSLTKERKDELLRKRDEKQTELRILQSKSAKDIWMEDLNNLLEKVSTVTSAGVLSYMHSVLFAGHFYLWGFTTSLIPRKAEIC